MKTRILLFAALLTGTMASAQNEVDALRYSFLSPQGSARVMGMSGAFGALGADLSVLSTNPAGIAIYRSNEFSFTPSIQSTTLDVNYNGTPTSDNKSLLQVSSLGIVGAYEGQPTGWRSFNFGIGYNKLQSFQENVRIAGFANNSTLLDVFTEQANGYFESELYDFFPFAAALAYDTYLINPTDTTGVSTYTNLVRDGGLTNDIQQIKNIERTGSMGETVLSGGANYMDRLYLGLTLGFPNVRYRELSTYTENEFNNTTDISSWNYKEDLLTTGNGFNFKLGAIYRASKWLRVGAAFHSPSWLTLRDSYETEVIARFYEGSTLNSISPLGNYEYNLRTPMRYMANAAFIIGKAGVISADYEFVDYSSSKLKPSQNILDDYDFSSENSVIRDIYRGTHNVRVGAELRLADFWRVRGGAAYQQSPYVEGATQSDGDILSFSTGVGYRNQDFFIDLAFAMSTLQRDYYLYDPEAIPAANIESRRHTVALTFGMRY